MEVWLILGSLLLAGYFAGTETAFLSVSRIRIEGFLHRGRWGAKSARWFLEKPARFVLTTLVGTNLGNIAASSLLTAYLIGYEVPTAWILPISTLMVLIIAEIIPKSLGRDLAEPAALWVAPSLRFFQFIFYPIIVFVSWNTTLIVSLFGQKSVEVKRFFTRRDFELLIREGQKTGALQPRHQSLISRALHFRTATTHDVMTPRTEIVALELNDGLEDLRRVALSSGFSKIPVYQNDVDHIIGIAYALDLFNRPETLAQIIRPVPFFPGQKKAWEAFRDLRAAHQSIAVVVDEYGGTAGIVTLEDFIEEVTGDIEDEHDPARLALRQVSENKWVVSARMEVEELNQRLNLDIPEGEYETLGGYITESLGRIPQRGEVVELGDYRVEILRSTRTRIRVVVVEKIEGEEV
ncbi:MAG: hemolysin family protein [bacterium]|nr:hemolysin family protein [bacterium]